MSLIALLERFIRNIEHNIKSMEPNSKSRIYSEGRRDAYRDILERLRG